MILKAQLSNLDTIHKLTQACAKAMIRNGIYQWNEQYPTRERILQDIELEELYILKENTYIKGMIVLTECMDKEYQSIKWLTTTNQNLYVHRLAINPTYWSQGYAQKLMGFAEQYAHKKKYLSIRLDTFSQNQRNQKFYETRGYKRLGDIYFPKQSIHPFHCYELVL